MKNWKTTIGGILGAVGTYLSNSQVGTLQVVGQVLQALGVFLIGAAAQDASTSNPS